ncbi:MAG: hypothetical protein IT359_10770 [Gemmatimonadaceae bacterium]|nr:hypothetical protein [Gemmatimonadaceae bacterium]
MTGRHERPPSATRADVRRLAWITALFYPFIGLAAYGARALVGHRSAVWLGLGFGVLATVAIWLSAAVGVLINWWLDRAEHLERPR